MPLRKITMRAEQTLPMSEERLQQILAEHAAGVEDSARAHDQRGELLAEVQRLRSAARRDDPRGPLATLALMESVGAVRACEPPAPSAPAAVVRSTVPGPYSATVALVLAAHPAPDGTQTFVAGPRCTAHTVLVVDCQKQPIGTTSCALVEGHEGPPLYASGDYLVTGATP